MYFTYGRFITAKKNAKTSLYFSIPRHVSCSQCFNTLLNLIQMLSVLPNLFIEFSKLYILKRSRAINNFSLFRSFFWALKMSKNKTKSNESKKGFLLLFMPSNQKSLFHQKIFYAGGIFGSCYPLTVWMKPTANTF